MKAIVWTTYKEKHAGGNIGDIAYIYKGNEQKLSSSFEMLTMKTSQGNVSDWKMNRTCWFPPDIFQLLRKAFDQKDKYN